jgi:hypothetical protein
MLFSCSVIATTTDAVRETCGNAAAYLIPLDAKQWCERMHERVAASRISGEECGKQIECIAAFSWRKSANALQQFLGKPGR